MPNKTPASRPARVSKPYKKWGGLLSKHCNRKTLCCRGAGSAAGTRWSPCACVACVRGGEGRGVGEREFATHAQSVRGTLFAPGAVPRATPERPHAQRQPRLHRAHSVLPLPLGGRRLRCRTGRAALSLLRPRAIRRARAAALPRRVPSPAPPCATAAALAVHTPPARAPGCALLARVELRAVGARLAARYGALRACLLCAPVPGGGGGAVLKQTCRY